MTIYTIDTRKKYTLTIKPWEDGGYGCDFFDDAEPDLRKQDDFFSVFDVLFTMQKNIDEIIAFWESECKDWNNCINTESLGDPSYHLDEDGDLKLEYYFFAEEDDATDFVNSAVLEAAQDAIDYFLENECETDEEGNHFYEGDKIVVEEGSLSFPTIEQVAEDTTYDLGAVMYFAPRADLWCSDGNRYALSCYFDNRTEMGFDVRIES